MSAPASAAHHAPTSRPQHLRHAAAWPLALLCIASLSACGGGGGGGGAATETAQNINVPVPTPETVVQVDALNDGAQVFQFKVDAQLQDDAALQKAVGGTVYSAWNPKGSNALYAPGMKVNFFGRGSGCDAGAGDGPVDIGDDRVLPTVAAATGVATTNSTLWRYAPSGGFSLCSQEARSLQGPNMVLINPQTGTGGVALYTRTGPDTGVPSLLRPYDVNGQNGGGANAYINGTFVTFRQDWRSAPRFPWLADQQVGIPSARIVATQGVAAMEVGTTVIADQPVQAKQQVSVNFISPTCMAGGASAKRPCQLQYVFNTAIERAGVDDWTAVSWFQNGKVWFDPAQGGTPIVDVPVATNGSTVVDGDSGLGLYVSRGNATQHGAFSSRDFDMRISFEQLANVLRIVAGRKNGVAPSVVSDAQMAELWGSDWNQRNAWALLSVGQAQEVHNPLAERNALIGGSFQRLYVGPQS